MARLMFVDDEPRVLEGIDNMLFDREEWEREFATNAPDALQILSSEPRFDAVITDMRMPGMDGLQLLEHVARDYPHMMRVVLSGHAELDRTMRAITIAHQYLGKPCDQQQLSTAISRALRIGAVVHDDQLRRNLGTLSGAPHDGRGLHRIHQLSLDERVSCADLERLVAADVPLAAKLLQAANSAVYGGGAVSTIGGAVLRLGARGVGSLALAIELHGRLGITDPALLDRTQRHSIAVASLASSLVADASQRDLAYLCGLLHDVGTMTLMLNFPERMARCHEARLRGEGPLSALERREFGLDHGALGSEILELFGMHEIAPLVRFHHEPSRADGAMAVGLLASVHVADAVEHGGSGPAEMDLAFLAGMGSAGEALVARAGRLKEAA